MCENPDADRQILNRALTLVSSFQLDVLMVPKVQGAKDVQRLRQHWRKCSSDYKNLFVISKVQNLAGFSNIEDIIYESDAILIPKDDYDIPPEMVLKFDLAAPTDNLDKISLFYFKRSLSSKRKP